MGPTEAPAPVLAHELARLEAFRRISTGAAHALHNAFTTLVGEASFLADDRKSDPVVADACAAMLRELERCTRLSRAVLARREPSQRGGQEVELVRLVRELGTLLRETLGSQHVLHLETADDILPVVGQAEDVELLVLSLVHHAADSAGGPVSLRLGAKGGGADGLPRLELEVHARGLPPRLEALLQDPRCARDPLERARFEGVAGLLARLHARAETTRPVPDCWRVRLVLRAPDPESPGDSAAPAGG